MSTRPQVDPKLDLLFERTVPVSAQRLWRAWTTPEHLLKWFAPLPWKTVACEIDLRPGGVFSTTMQSPEGETMPTSPGCYLEVVENERLVFTDALGPDYRPNSSSFMTAYIMFEPDGDQTRYVVVVKHATPEARKQHEEMGFHHGWGAALDQLVALESGD